MAHAGGHVPVDGPDVVAGLIFANLLESDAGSLEHALVLTAQQVLDGAACPQLQAANLADDFTRKHRRSSHRLAASFCERSRLNRLVKLDDRSHGAAPAIQAALPLRILHFWFEAPRVAGEATKRIEIGPHARAQARQVGGAESRRFALSRLQH